MLLSLLWVITSVKMTIFSAKSWASAACHHCTLDKSRSHALRYVHVCTHALDYASIRSSQIVLHKSSSNSPCVVSLCMRHFNTCLCGVSYLAWCVQQFMWSFMQNHVLYIKWLLISAALLISLHEGDFTISKFNFRWGVQGFTEYWTLGFLGPHMAFSKRLIQAEPVFQCITSKVSNNNSCVNVRVVFLRSVF